MKRAKVALNFQITLVANFNRPCSQLQHQENVGVRAGDDVEKQAVPRRQHMRARQRFPRTCAEQLRPHVHLLGHGGRPGRRARRLRAREVVQTLQEASGREEARPCRE